MLRLSWTALAGVRITAAVLFRPSRCIRSTQTACATDGHRRGGARNECRLIIVRQRMMPRCPDKITAVVSPENVRVESAL